MHKVLMVIRREYLDRVRKKSFWIGTLIFPLLMVGMFGIQFAAMFLTPEVQKTVALVDTTGRLHENLARSLDAKLSDGRPEYVLERVDPRGAPDLVRRDLEPQVLSGELFAILAVGDDLGAKDNFRLYTKNVGNVQATEGVARALRSAVIGLRLERTEVGLTREALDRITAPVPMTTFQVTAAGEARQKGFVQTWIGTIAFVMLLYVSLLLYGVAMMRGILEEKSNRVMEVLLGSLTPDQLMTGKILGIGLVGLTQMAVYAVTALLLRLYVLSRSFEGDWGSVFDLFTPLKMFYFGLFFLLGYFLYTAMFAVIGAVCNTEQEAQNLQGPIVGMLVLPMLLAFFFVNNPDSTAALVTSLIPFFTPMVMFMRISVLTPPFWQIALSIVLTAGTVWLLFRGAAKVFRVGILMYGKRPTIPEIWRWARS
jgi:ABC-2 type transport system permease protein